MIWLYLGWRVLARVRGLLLAAALGLALFAAHGSVQRTTTRALGHVDHAVQHDFRQALDGRGRIGKATRSLRDDLQRGLEHHVLKARRDLTGPTRRG
jgi:hypothetical protein